VVVPAGNVAKAKRLTLPGAVDRKCVNAAIRKLDSGKKNAELLRIIEAIKADDRRRPPARLGRSHKPCRQSGPLVRHLHPLYVRPSPRDTGFETAQAVPISCFFAAA